MAFQNSSLPGTHEGLSGFTPNAECPFTCLLLAQHQMAPGFMALSTSLVEYADTSQGFVYWLSPFMKPIYIHPQDMNDLHRRRCECYSCYFSWRDEAQPPWCQSQTLPCKELNFLQSHREIIIRRDVSYLHEFIWFQHVRREGSVHIIGRTLSCYKNNDPGYMWLLGPFTSDLWITSNIIQLHIFQEKKKQQLADPNISKSWNT